jgi:hypothetical protein
MDNVGIVIDDLPAKQVQHQQRLFDSGLKQPRASSSVGSRCTAVGHLPG